jgi:hypothetical protein
MRGRVGHAIYNIYKDGWIGGLSDEDYALVKGPLGIKYRARPTAAGIYPTEVAPCPHGKAVKLDRAIGRFARLEAQYSVVDSWIEDHGLPVDPRQPADRTTFDEIMRREFPNAPPARRGPKAEVITRVLNEMEADVAEGRLTIDQLRDLKVKQLEARYDASTGYVWGARKLFLKPHEQTPKTNN